MGSSSSKGNAAAPVAPDVAAASPVSAAGHTIGVAQAQTSPASRYATVTSAAPSTPPKPTQSSPDSPASQVSSAVALQPPTPANTPPRRGLTDDLSTPVQATDPSLARLGINPFGSASKHLDPDRLAAELYGSESKDFPGLLTHQSSNQSPSPDDEPDDRMFGSVAPPKPAVNPNVRQDTFKAPSVPLHEPKPLNFDADRFRKANRTDSPATPGLTELVTTPSGVISVPVGLFPRPEDEGFPASPPGGSFRADGVSSLAPPESVLDDFDENLMDSILGDDEPL